jgi:hypothetical protein
VWHEVSRAMSFELSSMSPLATRPWCWALMRETVQRFLITVRRPLTALAETQEMSSAAVACQRIPSWCSAQVGRARRGGRQDHGYRGVLRPWQ